MDIIKLENGKLIVNKFDTQQEIKDIAQYYIELLGLQDWQIIFRLGKCSDSNWCGECEPIFEEKCARITISDNIEDDLWFKQPQELTLIHELLHCKIPMFDNSNIDGWITHNYYHTILNDWAVSIMNARYEIDKNWYYNEEDK